jgi:cysteinyl-tRNA synthetase
VRAINQALERGRPPEGQIQEVRLELGALLDMLGLGGLSAAGTAGDVPDEVRDMLRRREDARAARDFAGADALRDAIGALGFELRDGPDGPEVIRTP